MDYTQSKIYTTSSPEPLPTVFMFFSRSNDVPPGRGMDETICRDNQKQYGELGNIPGWRKMLSNFYARADTATPLFKLDGLHWRSVEHYLQANKFVYKNPDYYRSFALESWSEIAIGDGAKAHRAGRAVKLSPVEVEAWDARKATVLARAREAKFTQNPDCARVLKLTDGALLTHRASARSPLYYESELMKLRTALLGM